MQKPDTLIIKRLFISQPMHGIDDDVLVSKARSVAEAFVRFENPEAKIGSAAALSKPINAVLKRNGERCLMQYNIINNIFKEFVDNVMWVQNPRLWYLGSSIAAMSTATDVIFAEEDTGAQAKGCKVERAVCAYYGIRSWQYHADTGTFDPLIMPAE